MMLTHLSMHSSSSVGKILFLCIRLPGLQGWRSPGFLVSRASSHSSTSSCNSSDVSPSSSSPSLDSQSSSPLPGEPAGPRDPQSHTCSNEQPQTTRWLTCLQILRFPVSAISLTSGQFHFLHFVSDGLKRPNKQIYFLWTKSKISIMQTLNKSFHTDWPFLRPQGPQYWGAPPPSLSQWKRDSSACKCSSFTLWMKGLTRSLRPRLWPSHRRWTAPCFYWLAMSSTGDPTLGYAPITSVWSTSGAQIHWSRTLPWNSSPSQTGRHEVWKKCEESNQESYCFTAQIQ